MRLYYDLHIHSCLSPCGDADMTPANLVNMAKLAGYSLIALTDHNSCANCPAVCELAAANDLLFLPGMELCTAEEAHVVCLFSSLDAALSFDKYITLTLPPIDNRPDIFGQQLIMDGEDHVIGQVDTLLTTASSVSLDDVLPLVRQFGGTAFPAHIDRPSYSVTAALGTVPSLGFQAVEITAAGDVPALCRMYPEIQGKIHLLDSDAHYLHQIADPSPWLELPEKSPQTVIDALNGYIPCMWGRS